MSTERSKILFRGDVADELDVAPRTAGRYIKESGKGFQVGKQNYWAIYRSDLPTLRRMRDEKRRRNPTVSNDKK